MSQIIKGSTAYPPHGFQQQSAYNNVQQPSYQSGYAQPSSCNNVPQQEQQSNIQLENYIQDTVNRCIGPYMEIMHKYLSEDAFNTTIATIKDSILHDLNEDIRKQVSEELRSQLQELSRKSHKVEYSENKEDFSSTNNEMNYARKANVSEKDKSEFEDDYKMQREFGEYVKEYLQLQKEEGFRLNQAIEEFWHRWKIEKFKCVNSSEKIQDPDIKPEFKSEEDGYFWASPLDMNSYYMVLPAIKITYEATRHNSMGFKEAFISGYTNGAFDIKPEKPAIFKKDNNTWSIVRDGKLRLFRS